MRRIDKPVVLPMMSFRCDPSIAERLSAIAARDSVTRGRVLRRLIAFALPHFEADAPSPGRPEKTPTEVAGVCDAEVK